MLTFADCAAMLTANGYAPAPLGIDGRPPGPFAAVQMSFARYPQYANAPVAVLTALPDARSPSCPVQDAAATRLALLTVRVDDARRADVDAIIARHLGSASCPVRVADDGSRVHMLRLTGPLFSAQSTGYQHVVVDASPAFVKVDGTWEGGDLLSVFRSELPAIDRDGAEALVREIGDMLATHEPPPPPVIPYVPRPLLSDGERLVFGNSRALRVLRGNGYTVVPTDWAKRRPTVSASAIVYGIVEGDDSPYAQQDVALLTTFSAPRTFADPGVDAGDTWLAEIELDARPPLLAQQCADKIAALGPSLVRVAGTKRVYIFRRQFGAPLRSREMIQGAADSEGYHVPGSRVALRVACAPSILISGTDEHGATSTWEGGHPLTTPRDSLAELDVSKVQQLFSAVEKLLASGTALPSPPLPEAPTAPEPVAAAPLRSAAKGRR